MKPRVSRPAAPASARKHGVHEQYEMGLVRLEDLAPVHVRHRDPAVGMR
jgi:hypothetical protein